MQAQASPWYFHVCRNITLNPLGELAHRQANQCEIQIQVDVIGGRLNFRERQSFNDPTATRIEGEIVFQN